LPAWIGWLAAISAIPILSLRNKDGTPGNGTTRRDMAKATTERVLPSSGNVFADMGLADAAELDTKARLAAAINRIVERRRLTQAEVAVALEINQPKVSALLHYKLEGFSVERLMRFLVALGQDVEIVVKAKPRNRSARIAVCAA
jgi:predicted XRE-type DNA-binding protein